ncbi:Metallo-beta-lactamase [Comamonadaceae bacterium]
MKLEVERTQYGVGQGNFHVQRITVQGPASTNYVGKKDAKVRLPFDFVYDCGSNQSSLSTSLSWAIKHYRPKKTYAGHKTKVSPTVDALFISHFHEDHISGVQELCNEKEVERLFVPYHTPEEVLIVLAQNAEWLATAQLLVVKWFLQALCDLAARRRIFNLQTVYVVPANDDGFQPGEGLIGPELAEFPGGVIVNQADMGKAKLKSGEGLTFELEDREVWEIRAWHFKPVAAAPASLVRIAQKLSGVLGAKLENLPKITDEMAGRLKAAAESIKKDLVDAVAADEDSDFNNHNIVSMCLYSGPVKNQTGKGTLVRMNAPAPIWANQHEGLAWIQLYGAKLSVHGDLEYGKRQQLGWLGTGDAMLAKKNVWASFDDELEWTDKRAELVATIQIPHHGSASGQNYNSQLVESNQALAVFSTAALSKHHHPSATVISDLLRQGCAVVNVTEYVRPGVVEVVTV